MKSVAMKQGPAATTVRLFPTAEHGKDNSFNQCLAVAIVSWCCHLTTAMASIIMHQWINLDAALQSFNPNCCGCQGNML